MSKIKESVVALHGPHIALCDVLKLADVVSSGGMGKALVAAGEVRVDGIVELRKTAKIQAGQVVTWQNQRILVQEV